MDDPVLDAFVAEGADLDELLAGLSDAQWQHPSACAGWSVGDVVLHLAQSEEGVVAAFDHGDPSRPFAPYADAAGRAEGGAVDAIMDAAVAAERPDDPRAPLERWRGAHGEVVARFRAADPSDRVTWITVPLAARTLAATRLSEHWIHGLDIREPLGLVEPDADRLAVVARLAWRTLPYAFELAGESDAPSTQVVLTSASGERWVFGDDDAQVHIEGPAGDWCRVAARRLTPEQSALRATGDRADRVLALARTYA